MKWILGCCTVLPRSELIGSSVVVAGDAAGVKAEFFADTTVEPNFIVNLGYGTDENLHPRNPRPTFDEACTIL